jgi:hypothetical protein
LYLIDTRLFFSLKDMPNKQKEPEDKQPDDLEEIQAELRLYGDESDSDNDAGWDLGKEERL